jgi:hypothetical protein
MSSEELLAARKAAERIGKAKGEGKVRQLMLLGWGILALSPASFWTLPAQEVVAHVTTKNDRGYEFPGLPSVREQPMLGWLYFPNLQPDLGVAISSVTLNRYKLR